MKLKSYYGKNVSIKAVNGKIFSGNVDEYFYPEDNDNEEESIVLKTSNNELIEFSRNDISDITIN